MNNSWLFCFLPKSWYRIKYKILFLILGFILFLSVSNLNLVKAESSLPVPQVHPLPEKLRNWEIENSIGDYFEQIKSTPVGYLIWSQFPLQIYIEKPPETDLSIASVRRFWQWVATMKIAVTEWNEYLPIIEIENEELADIIIKRSQPDLKPKFNSETGLFDFPPATTAETKYKFYLSEDSPPLLLHKMTIIVSPNLADESLLAAIRHELGHALGIWGHSNLPTDALYFSQVRNSPCISVRDINTLKKIYQQPTRLGWPINYN